MFHFSGFLFSFLLFFIFFLIVFLDFLCFIFHFFVLFLWIVGRRSDIDAFLVYIKIYKYHSLVTECTGEIYIHTDTVNYKSLLRVLAVVFIFI